MGEPFTLTPEESYRALIDEFDMSKKTCKIILVSDLSTRHAATVVDALGEMAGNPYALAMAHRTMITIRAKIKTHASGKKEFRISDIEQDDGQKSLI